MASDFNYDFHATTDEAVAPVEYNYRDAATLLQLGQVYHVKGEQPGVSVFLRDTDRVFHTYSTYGRGLDNMLATNSWLDLTPFGRGEGWTACRTWAATVCGSGFTFGTPSPIALRRRLRGWT